MASEVIRSAVTWPPWLGRASVLFLVLPSDTDNTPGEPEYSRGNQKGGLSLFLAMSHGDSCTSGVHPHSFPLLWTSCSIWLGEEMLILKRLVPACTLCGKCNTLTTYLRQVMVFSGPFLFSPHAMHWHNLVSSHSLTWTVFLQLTSSPPLIQIFIYLQKLLSTWAEIQDSSWMFANWFSS